MIITKAELQSCLAELPDRVDTEDVMYRLYLLEKIEAGDDDIRSGRVLSDEEAEERVARKWRE